MPELTHPFDPIFDSSSKILILGSFPSVRSREIGFYYAHPSNRFWPMMEVLGNTKMQSVSDKIEFLLSHNIALWDSLASCSIEGSDDAAITNEVPNDLSGIIDNSRIQLILANGKKAYDVALQSKPKRELLLLPSTSAQNARWTLSKLISAWKPFLDCCFNQQIV